jgi:adenylate cyclase
MGRHAAFLVILLCGVLLAATRATEYFDHKLLDLQFRFLRAWFPQPVPREVVVVGIDDDTVRRFPEPISLWHRHLARFLSAMAQARPSVVGVDIVLPERSFDAVLPGSDRELMKGMVEARRSYALVLAVTVDPAGYRRAIHPPLLMAAGPDTTGFALFPVDRDGVVRRFDERLEGGEAIPTFVGQMARHLKLETRAGFIDFWRGPRFDYVPLQEVLKWYDEKDTAALERSFRNRPVLVGMMLPFTDRQVAPVPLAAREPDASDTPGVLLHAQALRNLLGRGFIQYPSRLMLAGLAAGAALLWFVSSSTVFVAGFFVALSVALLAVSTWLLSLGWFVPVLTPLLTSAAALGGRHAYETLLKLQERQRLRASFSGYVSPAVMDEILAGHIKPELGGTKKFVCVMFSDIRGYTMRSERMAPEEIIRFLNRYFEQIVSLVHGRDGSVVSFMGDGIMAVFGAPKPLENPCREAFEVARGMLEFVTELNRQFVTEGEAPVDIGVGLNAGLSAPSGTTTMVVIPRSAMNPSSGRNSQS